MRVLVTGGAGFIGTNLVRELLVRGHSISILDDLSTGLESNILDLNVSLINGHVEDADLVHDVVTGHDSVVHLAARGSVPRSIRNPIATHRANVDGTLSILEAARSLGVHVVFSSSSSVYGANTTSPKNESLPIAPLSPYAASKASAESYMSAYRHAYGLESLALRFFNVYGPWQRPDHVYAAVIPKWIWAALHNQQLTVNGDGSITRDFTYVADVIAVLVNAIEQRMSYATPVNLAFGHPISLNALLGEIKAQIGDVQVQYGPARLGDIHNSENDPELLYSLFPGFTPTTIQEGLKATVDWLSLEGERVVGIPLTEE